MASSRWDVGGPEFFEGAKRVDDRRYFGGAMGTGAALAGVVVFNDVFREAFLRPMVGDSIAVASSNLTLLVLAMVPMVAFGRSWKPESAWLPWAVGALWCFIVAAVEVLIELLAMGKDFAQVAPMFDPGGIVGGNFYVGVLLIVLCAPAILSRQA